MTGNIIFLKSCSPTHFHVVFHVSLTFLVLGIGVSIPLYMCEANIEGVLLSNDEHNRVKSQVIENNSKPAITVLTAGIYQLVFVTIATFIVSILESVLTSLLERLGIDKL